MYSHVYVGNGLFISIQFLRTTKITNLQYSTIIIDNHIRWFYISMCLNREKKQQFQIQSHPINTYLQRLGHEDILDLVTFDSKII